jgi:hypothetical protein
MKPDLVSEIVTGQNLHVTFNINLRRFDHLTQGAVSGILFQNSAQHCWGAQRRAPFMH